MDKTGEAGFRALFIPLYVPSFLFSSMEGMLLLVVPLYLLDLGMNLSIVGLILAGRPVGMLVADIPVGMLIGRYGRKTTMILGLAAFGCANIGMFFTVHVLAVFLLQFLVGISASAYTVSRLTSFVEMTEPDNRGRSIALMGGANRCGYFAGPVVGGGLAAAVDLSSTFLLIGALSLVALVLVFKTMQERRADSNYVPITFGAHISRMNALLLSQWRALLSAGLGMTLAQLIRAARPVFIPLFGAQALGLSVDQIGIIVGAGAAVDMSLFYCAGWLMDNWGRKASIVPSFTIQTVGIALLPFVGSFTSLLLVSCLIGLGNGLGSGNMMTLGGDLAPRESRGEFLGMWRLIGDAGQTGAPLLIGSVAQILTLGAAAFSVATLGSFSVLLFLFVVPETHRRKRSKDSVPK